jgi:type IV pilus assembly protein PilV
MINKNSTRGFTLIEVLVALLIVAVGLLSIAALQLQGLKFNHEAYLRTQISMLAYEIADSMRLNRANAADYVDNYTVTTAAPAGCVPGNAGDAANDLACWRQQVFYSIPPGGTANITEDAGLYTVTLSWKEKDEAATERSITYTFQP